MRPNETCYGLLEGIADYICSPSGFAKTCKYYTGDKRSKHSCEIFDALKKLRERKGKTKKLLDKFKQEDLLSFFKFCLPKVEVNNVSTFEGGCIKCGRCCIEPEFTTGFLEKIGFILERVNPKTGQSQKMCKYLAYYEEYDNRTDDLGWRCLLYGKPERPKSCKQFPTGKEDVLFPKWINNEEITFGNLLPLCPAVFEEAL